MPLKLKVKILEIIGLAPREEHVVLRISTGEGNHEKFKTQSKIADEKGHVSYDSVHATLDLPTNVQMASLKVLLFVKKIQTGEMIIPGQNLPKEEKASFFRFVGNSVFFEHEFRTSRGCSIRKT